MPAVKTPKHHLRAAHFQAHTTNEIKATHDTHLKANP